MSDPISRQAAIDALIEWYGCEPSDLDYFKEIVEKLPSADRPQGEWVNDYSSPVAYRCTACNTLQHWSVIQNGRYRFCPNCGARMKGAKDDAI